MIANSRHALKTIKCFLEPPTPLAEAVMAWIVNGSIQEGHGTAVGSQPIGGWQTVESFAGPTSGTATYTITQDGVLYGSRTLPNE
ncbi:MAG: hypothetical protein ACFB51_01090 [Anaerolineae bacterium]